ncbi:hypothetical protein [Hyalangium gracile]|uniref:hypothetical protein n=1 Tax=Hyalangium gracile TaxID=394092 RepID=UPI001CCC4BE7|nr:hypothetical protein [Hyalangium gracile]
MGLGLTELTFAEGLCRRLGAPGAARLVRVLGARELFTGMGLLSQKEQRPWLWGRVAGDSIDLSLLGATFGSRRGSTLWRIAATVAVLGITLVDVYAASGRRPRRIARPSALDPLNSGGPAESWRGSGLAEDVGAPRHGAGSEEDEAERQQRMRDAERQLGLPPV